MSSEHVLECVETVAPVLTIGFQPLVELEERLQSQLVHPTLGVPAYGNQPGVLEDLQVLGRLRLAKLESSPDQANRMPAVSLRVSPSSRFTSYRYSPAFSL